MNNFQRRQQRQAKREKQLAEKELSKPWIRYGLSYLEYRAVYQKWKLALKRGHNVTLEFYVLNKDKRIQLKNSQANAYLNSKLKKYGLTKESYNNMVSKQNNCCAICGTNPSIIGEELSIDHCHATGKVRGLLCRPCNLGIGNLKDNLELVLKAANYLSASCY